MIAIRVCPICKKKFEGRVGVPKVYCDDCTITQDLVATDEAVKESSWFFDGDRRRERPDSRSITFAAASTTE